MDYKGIIKKKTFLSSKERRVMTKLWKIYKDIQNQVMNP
jgi:hypothetical protein